MMGIKMGVSKVYKIKRIIVFIIFISGGVFSQKSDFELYKVLPGENYYVIGKKFKINYPELVKFNKNKQLRAGTEIKIPNFFHYRIKAGDNFYNLSKKFKISVSDLIELNLHKKKLFIDDFIKVPKAESLTIKTKKDKKSNFSKHSKEKKKVKSLLNDLTNNHKELIKKYYEHLTFVWPVSGKIEQNFGIHEDILNQGILIKLAKKSKKVFASEKGKVAFIGNIRGFGKSIIISHSSEVFSAYMGLREVSVKLSQSVRKNSMLARGNDRLFFSVFIKGSPEDPMHLLSRSIN